MRYERVKWVFWALLTLHFANGSLMSTKGVQMMVKCIDLGDQIYGCHEFAFYDTVTDRFISFNGTHTFHNSEVFKETFKYNEKFKDIERFLDKIPDKYK